MKTISFTKMAGAGNDFLVLEDLKKINPQKLALQMCARENGVGSDGLLILEPSKTSDYKMRIINPDGSEAEMCGNGVRCLAAYIVRHRKPKKKFFTIETLAGEILAQAKDETAHVRLSAPKDYQANITIMVKDRQMRLSTINTGVPHTVIFVDGLKDIDAGGIGPLIRFHPRFAPAGTNVNFVEQIEPGLIAVRTFERGVEDETKACGTGAVASGIVGFLKTNPAVTSVPKARMKVITRSGEILQVTFRLEQGIVSDVWLKGSAKFIAKGEYYV